MRKLALLLAAVLAVLCLCGCTPTTDAEKLLRTPRSGGETGQLQKALDTYLNESAQLKFPTSGKLLSPFLFGDWDGDGTQDAAVLFAAESIGQNVNLALLEKREEQWRVIDLCEGLASEVHSVTVAAMQESQASQLLVEYGSPQSGLYLTVYAWGEGGMDTLLQQTCSQQLLYDLSNSGSDDLILVLPEDENGNIELQVLTNTREGFHLSQQITVGRGIFTGCANLAAGKSLRRKPYLVVDGYVGSSGSSLASTIITYDTESGSLVPYLPSGAEDMLSATQRYSTMLTSRDMDGNGTVDIPLETPWNIQEELQHRITALSWKDFVTGSSRTDLYGLWDTDNNFFIALPKGMAEDSMVVASGSGWQVCDPESGEVYLTVRLATANMAMGEFIRVAFLGNRQIQVRFGKQYPGLTLQSVQSGTKIL